MPPQTAADTAPRSYSLTRSNATVRTQVHHRSPRKTRWNNSEDETSDRANKPVHKEKLEKTTMPPECTDRL